MALMGGSNDKPFEQISAASNLNNMLERRIACQVPSSIDSDIESPPSMHSSSASMAPRGPAVPPITIPQHRASTLNETPSPRSIVSSTGTPPGFSVHPFLHHTSMTPEVKPQNLPQYGYQYEQLVNNSWSYQNEAHYTSEPIPYYNTSSCVDAANIIRTMRSDIGNELENDLGCRSQDQNCYVDNSLVFNMMEKYSDPRSGV